MVRLRRKVGVGPNGDCGDGAGHLVPAASVHPRRSVQRLCPHRHRQGAVIGNIGARPAAADGVFAARREIRQIRLRRRNIDAARPRDCRPRRLAVARPVRHRRHHGDLGRFFHPDAAAHAGQSGDRNRARAARRRIRALLPADRRYPLRPIARRRSPGALAQARRHAGAARLVHPARRIERADPRNDARPDAAGLRRSRPRHRLPAGAESLVQLRRPAVQRRYRSSRTCAISFPARRSSSRRWCWK